MTQEDSAIAEENQQIIESVKSGAYFSEARKWYDTVYMQPLPERIYFIVVTALAGFIFIMTFISVDNLLPLTDQRPYVYLNEEFNTLPVVTRLRAPDEDINSVMKRFMVQQFVNYYESYSEDAYTSNQRYIRNYAADDVYRRYKRYVDPKNPQSPLVRFQKTYDRLIEIDAVRMLGKTSPFDAEIDFTSTIVGRDQSRSQSFTARLSYEYIPWDVNEKDVVDPETNDILFSIDALGFKVVNYDVRARVQ